MRRFASLLPPTTFKHSKQLSRKWKLTASASLQRAVSCEGTVYSEVSFVASVGDSPRSNDDLDDDEEVLRIKYHRVSCEQNGREDEQQKEEQEQLQQQDDDTVKFLQAEATAGRNKQRKLIPMEITSSNGARPASISPYMLMDEIRQDDGDDGDMDDHSMHASSCERYQNSLSRRLGKRRDVLISSLGSFSTAYNIVNISLTMVSMNLIYPLSDEMKSLSASTMFAGMVAGQLGFGFVGDAIGLVRAFHLTMLLQVVGALASALVYGPHLYVILAMARFFLGIGAGGVYPLSAAVASNSSQKGTSDVIVALVFSLQGVAFVTMNAFATILAYVTDNDQVIFRLLLGMGALPGLLILLIEMMGTRMGRDVHAPAPGAQKASHMLSEAMSDPLTIKRLTGCSLTWFLYDVCFFGNTLFQPIIGDSVLGGDGSLRSESAESLIISLIALPGYFIAVVFINRLGPRLIQTQGFVICAALYIVLAITGQRLINNGLGSIALTLYGLSFTFFNFGPGCTTYLFPSKLFPREIKSSLNGVAAAAGKVGGFLGGYFFPALLAQFGLNVVLVICCIIALIGAVVTLATLDNQGPSLHHHHIAEGEDDEVREKDLG